VPSYISQFWSSLQHSNLLIWCPSHYKLQQNLLLFQCGITVSLTIKYTSYILTTPVTKCSSTTTIGQPSLSSPAAPLFHITTTQQWPPTSLAFPLPHHNSHHQRPMVVMTPVKTHHKKKLIDIFSQKQALDWLDMVSLNHYKSHLWSSSHT